MFKFNLQFFLLAVSFFIIELCIASFVHDSFIRPYFGDYLVVILIYCAVKSFVKIRPWKLAIGVLLFSYFVEILQFFSIVDRLGLGNNRLAKTVIGYGFEWLDL